MVTKPILRGHFHQAMFFIALGAGLPLLAQVWETKLYTPVLIYVLCTLMLFGISTLYHRITWTVNKRAIWKKLDHCSIYLMIAGNFTPVASIVLSEESGKKLLILIWSVAVAGIIQSIFFVNIPKILSSLLYIIAGYLILPYLPELQSKLGNPQIILIILGGLAYSVGAICYGLKRPVLNPKIFGYHEVFHIMVNIGATIHYIVIKSIISGALE